MNIHFMKGGKSMIFEFIPVAREKASALCEGARSGMASLDRYMVTKNVNTRTVITDTKSGKKLIDTEDCYTKEFSLFKFILSVIVIMASMAAFLISCRSSAKQRRKLKEQKKELRRIKKLCKKADIEIPENN